MIIEKLCFYTSLQSSSSLAWHLFHTHGFKVYRARMLVLSTSFTC